MQTGEIEQSVCSDGAAMDLVAILQWIAVKAGRQALGQVEFFAQWSGHMLKINPSILKQDSLGYLLIYTHTPIK